MLVQVDSKLWVDAKRIVRVEMRRSSKGYGVFLKMKGKKEHLAFYNEEESKAREMASEVAQRINTSLEAKAV